MNKETQPAGSNPVFWISAAVIAGFVVWGALSPKTLADNATTVFDWTTAAFGWFYLLSVLFFVLFCLFLALSRYGRIRLGKDGEDPEYPYFTWIGMLFSAGFGVGLVFWGVAEPMSHFFEPPMGLEPKTARAALMGLRYSFFHWGIHQWSVFTVVGLAIAYLQFRKDRPSLISNTFNPLIGEEGRPSLRRTLDILAVIATVIGVATSLGMGILQINGGLSHVFGIPKNGFTQLMITAGLAVLYLASSTSGLNRGIKWLSNLNLGLALGILVFVLVAGPTKFILDSFTHTLGQYIQHFFGMSLRLTPFLKGTWVRDWTVFYWAWVIAWSPFVGTFFARVSRGRTIREFVIGVLIVPPLIAILWMAVFGGSALHLDLFEGTRIGEAVQKDVALALFAMYEHFPFATLVSVLSILLIFTFLITSADSATYVLGMMTSEGRLNPPMTVKVIWGVLIAAISAVLILSSGLQGLQTASLVAALPFAFILLGMCMSLLRALKQERISRIPKL
ncbi:choline/carnitine/betaine transport [Melghirimyces profundicolus]|uniref:Choline/carnitine/betaine transport n=1 Tax=Melghirimyces profundicolus TaxID=1242148 RepID=A0A2T6C895_9BACL|nr:BCCT family transporter [Melghirimyces profundicolus]PTX64538.1 choline/carnitine/betaine transport [Melghirimyces profundicolus]